MRLSTRIAALAASITAVVMLATPALAARSHTTGKTIRVIATEFHFKLSTSTAPHGTVTFVVVNKGRLGHDFKIDGKKTPVIKPGKSAKLTVKLKVGRNPYLCTVAGHAAAGMKGVVKGK